MKHVEITVKCKFIIPVLEYTEPSRLVKKVAGELLVAEQLVNSSKIRMHLTSPSQMQLTNACLNIIGE